MNDGNTPLPSRKEGSSIARKSRKSAWIKRSLIALVLVLVLSGTAYGIYLYQVGMKNIDKMSIANNGIEVPEEEKADVKPLTILLLGLDSRENLGLMNTDVIMMLTLNPEKKTGTLVSLPRDTYVHPAGYREARKANQFYSIAKVNGYGEGEFGEVKTIFGDFFDIKPDYAVMINFKAFEDMIDALGGVNVYVDQDMKYVDNADGTNIDLKQGQQELNGKEALDFVRYRKSNRGTAPSSDFERNQRQQQVLSEMLNEAKSFSTTLVVDKLMNAVGDNVTTDMPSEQIKSFIKTYVGLTSNNIEYIPLEGSWRSPFIYLDEADVEQAKAKLKQQLNGETTPTPTETSPAE
ncbi:LCP family protein [Marinicrinis sediminis]|uniref:LCP family protein n=1 Tax=Marinicrinis sediminis TaxID=1652465 RepID=A0ABW5RBB9_9BACL